MSVQGLAMVFYEKPGCINNRRQKTILTAAGFELDVRNLLAEAWHPEELKSYFRDMPIREWFNPAAPRVKDGEINPGTMTESQALAAMVADPLLIRRPLMACGTVRQAGFNLSSLLQALGLAEAPTPEVPSNIESCPKGDHHHGCGEADRGGQ